jgi:hypothetical protein
MSPADPFTGTWKCNLQKSKFSTAAPLAWTQYITATADDLSVREEISRDAGPPAIVSVKAKYDGNHYSVHGSPIAEVIAYTRNGSRIEGTARKNGLVCLRETVTVSADLMVMEMVYSVIWDGKELGSGVAVFDRAEG